MENGMDAFAQSIEGWHDFYLMVGTAAATLVGLLFVSLSLNIAAITRKANDDLRNLAAQTFSCLLMVLMFSVLFLIPSQGPHGLGLPLLGMSGYGLYDVVSHFLKVRRKQTRLWGRTSVASRFILPTICYLTLLTVAISVLLGQTGSLYWLVPVMILLIISASRNAWDLLLRLREPSK
jgi:hypothetical protein